MELGMTRSTNSPENLIGDHPAVEVPVVVASGNKLKRGTVLGMVTENKKYVACDKTLNNGAETPVAILAADTDADEADEKSIAYVHGSFTASGLIWKNEDDAETGVAEMASSGIYVK